MAGEPTIDMLLANLNHTDEAIRLEAIRLLGERANMRAVKPLLVAHGRRTEIEKAAIMQAFRSMGEVVFPPLNTLLLRDVNPIIRADAAYILGELGNIHSIRPLSRSMYDPHEMVRAIVVVALDKFDHESVFGPLLVGLKDNSLMVQLECAIALGSRGDVRAVDLLIRAVEAQLVHPHNMPLLLRALGSTHDPRAVEVLADELLSDDPSIRAAAATGLGCIEDVRCIPVLEAALDDEDSVVHDAVYEALKRLKQ